MSKLLIPTKTMNDNYSLDDYKSDFSTLENISMVVEKAAGTANAITLNNIFLEDMYYKTFIATADNNGADTTINGKPVYKPGTTAAPTFISGKAYTVWYDLTNNCFFIKASAEGTATPDHVLATDTFSNNNDTGVQGTMVNNSAATQANIVKALNNLVTNGNFANGTTGWLADNSSAISAASNILSCTASNVSAFSDIYSNIGAKIIGHKYFIVASLMVTNSVCTLLKLGTGDIVASVNNPIINQWYTLSGIVTATSTYSNVVAEHDYVDSATTNGKVLQVKNFTVLDLTAIFGAGNEPTQAQMDAIMNSLGGYIDTSAVLSAIPNGAYINSGALNLPNITFKEQNGVYSSGSKIKQNQLSKTNIEKSTSLSTGVTYSQWTGLAISQNGRYGVVTMGTTLSLLDFDNNTIVYTRTGLNPAGANYQSAAVLNSGIVYLGAADNKIYKFDYSGNVVAASVSLTYGINSVTLSPDEDGIYVVFNSTVPMKKLDIYSLAVIVTGNVNIYGYVTSPCIDDKYVFAFDYTTGYKKLTKLDKNSLGAIASITFSGGVVLNITKSCDNKYIGFPISGGIYVFSYDTLAQIFSGSILNGGSCNSIVFLTNNSYVYASSGQGFNTILGLNIDTTKMYTTAVNNNQDCISISTTNAVARYKFYNTIN